MLKKYLIPSLLTIFLILANESGSFAFEGPEQDSTKQKTIMNKSRPATAAILSAVLPGAGQVYNKKYWKLPILYVGGGTLVFFAVDNYRSYQKYKEAYTLRTDNDPNTIDAYEGIYNNETILSLRNAYRRDYEFFVILSFSLVRSKHFGCIRRCSPKVF